MPPKRKAASSKNVKETEQAVEESAKQKKRGKSKTEEVVTNNHEDGASPPKKSRLRRGDASNTKPFWRVFTQCFGSNGSTSSLSGSQYVSKEEVSTPEVEEKPKKARKTAKPKETTKKSKAAKVVEEEPETTEETSKTKKSKTKTRAKKPSKQSKNDELEEDDKPKKTRGRKAKSTKKESVEEDEEENSDNVQNGEKEEDVEEIEKRAIIAKGRSKEEAKQAKEKALLNKTATNWASIDFNCTRKDTYGIKHNLIISTWNVGGLKSWVKKGCLEYLNQEKPDIFCIQEAKCSEDKLPDEIKELKMYKQYWCPSKKDGYAGVGLFSIKKPKNVTFGINDETQDEDGRCITAEYDEFFLVNVYVPNAGRQLVTLPKRLEWNKLFKSYIKSLDSKKPVIICGDMNVSHQEIDLARPKSNTKNAGFTPEEREGMTDFLNEGFVDVFRHLYPDQKDTYSFWTYMGNARAKNVGWRLDYFIVSDRIINGICDSVYRTEVLGSDHCPMTLFINI